MNRFDRVVSLLLVLQTRSVVTARFLAQHFNVSERTVYRDIRTLENAGVPIGAEAGVGYFLEKSYRLPPVCFTLDEAAALLLGERLLVSSLDARSRHDFNQALNKIRAVLNHRDKNDLSAFDATIEVLPTGSHFPIDDIGHHGQSNQDENPSRQRESNALDTPKSQNSGDGWLRECRRALADRQVVAIDYTALSSNQRSTRQIEPSGLFYYSWHWHLIAWCRLREGYRDFRLDRIIAFSPQPEYFTQHDRLTFKQYLDTQPGRDDLEDVELLFGPEAARFVEEQRYMFGFIGEERQSNGIRMWFRTPVPEYMARWLLQYTDDVKVIHGDTIKKALQRFSSRLATHWNGAPRRS